MTVFVPITLTAARELRSSGAASDLVGFADGPALRSWLGDARLDDEEADYVALNHAGVAALGLDDTAPTRLVLAVDIHLTGTDEAGAVRVPEVVWTDVRSLFADDAPAGAAVLRSRAAVRGLELADALVEPTVMELQDAHDLLWYAPEELDTLG
jgi:hypothetical protein